MEGQSGFRWMVGVRSVTYNQAEYIKDALDGFCMQETSFPFVCCIIDDASTDEEPKVLIDYMEENFELSDDEIVMREETDDYKMLFAQHKRNRNCFFAVFLLKYNHYGNHELKQRKIDYIRRFEGECKYIAMCEGDDYWISAFKLQKQVDFMEVHPDHSVCFTAHRNENPNGLTEEFHRYDRDVEECPIEDAIKCGGGYMATCSQLFRREAYENRPEWTSKLPIGDLPMMLVFLARGKCSYINEVMVTYRVCAEGSWTIRMRNDFEKKVTLFKGGIMAYKEFNKLTDKKYKRCIWERIIVIRFHLLKAFILSKLKIN